MPGLTVSRPMDEICYNDFIFNPFWAGILNYLEDKHVKTVIDIGASSGISALWMLDRLKEVNKYYCFEPDEESFNMLLINLSVYKDIIIPYNYGIYYGVKEAEVYGIGDNSPLGYTIQGAKDFDEHHSFIKYDNKIFKLMKLEDMMFATPADLIKIDVEGSEYNIIENSEYLKMSKYLLIAFHNKFQSFIQEFIKENLPQYDIVNYGIDGDIYANVLLERNIDKWLQLSFLRTDLEQTNLD